MRRMRRPGATKVVRTVGTNDCSSIYQGVKGILRSMALGVRPRILRVGSRVGQFNTSTILVDNDKPAIFKLIRRSSEVRQVCGNLEKFYSRIFTIEVLKRERGLSWVHVLVMCCHWGVQVWVKIPR